MQQYRSNSYLFGGNAPYVEELYEAYLDNPGSVPDNWRTYFDKLQNVPSADGTLSRDVAHAPVVESFAQRAKANAFALKASASELAVARKQVHVQSLIAAYRVARRALGRPRPAQAHRAPEDPRARAGVLRPHRKSDMDITFSATNTYFTKAEQHDAARDPAGAARNLLRHHRRRVHAHHRADREALVAGAAGVDPQQAQLQQRAEGRTSSTSSPPPRAWSASCTPSTSARSASRWKAARASSPAWTSWCSAPARQGVQEIVIGMAHRGRLNVLVNTLGKMPKDLFAEFDHTAPEDLPAGDVKYHQGFSSDVTTPGGPVHLSLAFNPSHLEIVNPVVEGSVKARMDRRGDKMGDQVLPVLVHGDAAFAGQGVVMETLALAQTRGYYTGGTVHLVINNQIGFTTSDPRDSRSTLYCTDVVKMIEAPVLHVNGDDPEAVVLCTQLALDYRMQFNKDVVRRHRLLPQARPQRAGHAEPDAAADVQEDRAASGHAQAVRRQAGRAGRAGGRRPRRDGQGACAPRSTPASTRSTRC